ncbi:hypothetical protein VTK26DRAFT_7790 [Humicola hyalothermophila]
MPLLPAFCVPRRCGACRFKLDDDEIIVLAKRDGFVVTGEPPFRSMMDEPYMLCVECNEGCSHSKDYEEHAMACHPGCLALVPLETESAFFEATSYQYQPPRVEDERRIRWLRRTWRSILSRKYVQLPVELCDHIAQYSLQPFAVLCGLALCETKSRHLASNHVSFSTKVWAGFTLFEGLAYILSLTNQQPTENRDTRVQLAFDPELAQPDTLMFLAEDHLGVRKVLFVPSSETPTVGNRPIKERPNIWWRAVVVLRPDSTVEGRFDGVTFRPSTCKPSPLSVLWSLPRPLTKKIRSAKIGGIHASDMPNVIRMAMFNCNDPAIIGYSVYRIHNFQSIHAHTRGEDTAFYQSNTSVFGVWQYMPVDSGEALVEIWKHQESLGVGETCLMFKTNKGRTALMGVWPLNPECNWTLLDRPSIRPGRIFYETSPSGIRWLGFETPPPTQGTRHSTFPAPQSVCPRWSLQNYYYTSAILDDITTVTPSWHQIEGISVITGLLFHSSNNAHTSCVGQVRLDSLGCPFEVSNPRELWLGFAFVVGGPCVVRATESRPSDAQSLTWLALPCQGLLEWWFSWRQCKIHHQGRESPPTCNVSPGLYRRFIAQQEAQSV